MLCALLVIPVHKGDILEPVSGGMMSTQRGLVEERLEAGAMDRHGWAQEYGEADTVRRWIYWRARRAEFRAG